MSRRTTVVLLSSLFLLGSQGAALAQEEEASAQPVWPAATAKGASDVATLGDGFIAVGAKKKPVASKAWSADDGLAWKRVPDDEAFKKAAMVRAEAFDGGLVVLGQQGRKLVGWHSPDGTTWERTNIDKAGKELKLDPEGLAAGPGGLLAIASVVGQDLGSQRFYRSTDGKEWSTVLSPPANTGGIFVSIKGSDDEYLAVARPAFTEDTSLYWRSTDGSAWESFEGPADAWLHDIAIGEDGAYVAVGSLREEDSLRPAIWHATELGSWELVYSHPSAKDPEDQLVIVEAAAPGFVAAGTMSGCPEQAKRTCPMASILASEDGRTWQALGTADGVPGPLNDTEVNRIASDGSTTVMLAWHARQPMEIWTVPVAE